MAEFLIYAKTHWMDDVPESERLKWDEKKTASYNRRLAKGNPVAVRPDGWKWGKAECLPDFIVVKSDMSVEEGEKYMESLLDEKSKEVLFRRKFVVDPGIMSVVVDGKIDIPKTTIDSVMIERTL